jgi:uncharacterized protein YndB with AHSA1/START domain
MIRFTITTDIDRPVGDVFAYVTDPQKLPTWQTNTVSVVQEGDGPLRVGTRLREVHRGPGGKELPSLVEVSELDPGRTFALRMLEGPLPIHGRIELAAGRLRDPDGVHGPRRADGAHARRPAAAADRHQAAVRPALREPQGRHGGPYARAMTEQDL